MSQSLYRKYRPVDWDEVIGQEHVIRTLRNAVASERVAHAYLFAGPRGTGKTSTARLLAKAVNCLADEPAQRPCNACEHCQAINDGRFLDLIEIDAASNTSVDDVRDLRDKINYAPNRGRYKVYIIDEVHMLSTAAFNALLKTLEEPPAHAIFILATTEVHKIPATVLSRCQRHEFRRISVREIRNQLERLAKEEKVEAEETALDLIARQATGSLRDAISLFDQLASSGEKISEAFAQQVLGTATHEAVLAIIDALLEEEPSTAMTSLHQALDSGSDPRQFARQVVEYLRGLLLVRMGNADQVDAPAEVRKRMAAHAQQLDNPTLLGWMRCFNDAASNLRNAWQPALPLEMALVEALAMRDDTTQPPVREVTGVKAKGKAVQKTISEEVVQKDEQKRQKPAGIKLETDPLPQNIQGKWDEIRRKTREYDPLTQALLNSCRPMGVHNGKLILAFTSDLIRSKMEQNDHIPNTQKAMQEVLGESMPIRCITAASERSRIPDGVDHDGMVATAIRDLGGEVVDSQ